MVEFDSFGSLLVVWFAWWERNGYEILEDQRRRSSRKIFARPMKFSRSIPMFEFDDVQTYRLVSVYYDSLSYYVVLALYKVLLYIVRSSS